MGAVRSVEVVKPFPFTQSCFVIEVWACAEYGYTYHCGEMTVVTVNGKSKLRARDFEEAIGE